MRLKPLLTVEVADPRDVFGTVSVPMVTMSETAREMNLPGCARDRVRWDDGLGCLYLEPARVAADEDLEAWTRAGGSWKLVQNRVTGKMVVRQVDAPTDADWTAERGAEGDSVLYPGQGLHLWLYRDAPKPDATRSAAGCFVAAAFTDAAGAGYRILWAYGQPPVLQSTEDGALWTHEGDLVAGDGGRAAAGGWGELLVEVLRVNGRLAFRAGASDLLVAAPLLVRDRELTYPFVLSGRGCNAAFTAAACAWPASGTFRNSERERPWNNTSPPVTRVDGSRNSTPGVTNAPDGVTMAVDTEDGAWRWRYTLELAPTDGGTRTPWVTRLHAVIPEVQVPPDPMAVWTALPLVDGFRLRHRFDAEECTSRVRGELHLYNHTGQWREVLGLMAVRVWAGLADEQGVLWGGYGAPDGLRFIGYMGLDSDLGEEDGWISLDDRAFLPQRKAFLNGVYADDDCLYHAVRMGAQHAGITSEWMQVGPGAPADCWTCDGVTCDPEAGHWRLGNGTGTSPRWRPEQGEKVWSFWQRIRRQYGMALGFTPSGHFTMYPWTPWTARRDWDASVRQVFSLVHAWDMTGRPRLNQVLAGARRRVSIRELVNSLTLLGLDQESWEPILAHRFDEQSAFGAGFGMAPPANYMGFLADAVESSTSYASRAEMDVVIERLFNLVRQPRLDLWPLPAWPQPRFVCDFVGVDGSLSRLVPGGDKYWIGAIDEDWGVVRGAYGAVRQEYSMVFGLNLVPYDLPSVVDAATGSFGVNGATDGGGAPVAYGTLDQSEAGENVLAS